MLAFAPLALVLAHVAAVPLADPWQREYTAAEAQDPSVIALWPFHTGEEGSDASGQGHDLKFLGAQPTEAGRFGGGLQSFPGWPVKDERHAAVAVAAPALSPSGAFTIDLWIKPPPDLPPTGNVYLLCKKYVSNNDYQLLLTAASQGNRRLQCNLGFGDDSEGYFSDAVEWPADVWQHVAVTYDGAGTVRFYRNGEPLGGRTAPGRRSITPGPLPLSIGDRTGSNYAGFAGVLDQVRISKGVREFGLIRVELDLERRVYLRHEPPPAATVRITNLQVEPLRQVRLNLSLSGFPLSESSLDDLKEGETRAVEVPIDTSLRPDQYELRIAASVPDVPGTAGPAENYRLTQAFPIRIVGRPLPDRMPVVMWGINGVSNIATELPRLKQIGFTHCLGLNVDMAQVWETKKPQESLPDDRQSEVSAVLDEVLAGDLRVLISLSPGSRLDDMARGEFARVDRDGKPLEKAGIDGLHPPVQQFCEDVGYSAGTLYSRFPAFAGALIHTEVRDHAAPSFGAVDREAYRQATGQEIPPGVTTKWGVNREKIPGFPENGVIPDDDPIYRYLQWYWREGDGWPGLNTATARGLKRGAANRPDLWTFHDPAVRVASVFGSGGDVDVLSQWTYSYPEPIRIGLPTDQLFAMARGADPAPAVMKMTQIIWYRSQTAPIARGDGPQIPSPWDDHDPDAAYITIAPMHLREAFWTKISRPIQGIMYHGWQSLVPTDSPSSYRYTHPETQHELQRLIHQVVEPFGPMLRRVPAPRNDVAFYESFAAQMFAGRGTYGWSRGWPGDCYQVLQHAGLQADVLYDESITRFGLDGYRIVIIPDGDVLTESVAERLRAFQKRGGLIVADDRLAPAIEPDIRLTPLVRSNQADRDKAQLLALAATLKQELAEHYVWPVESSNPDVVPYRRFYSRDAAGAPPSAGPADEAATYVFLVNDHREFGQYVGQHGLVQEVGRQSETTVTLRNLPPDSAVYDLLEHRRIETAPADEASGSPALTWRQVLGPCEGRMFLAVPRPIASLRITSPENTPRGQALNCVIEVLDDHGAPVPAVLPLLVELRDPDGRPAEFSGHHAAPGGRLELTFDLADNDLTGPWQLHVRDLASGLTLDRELIVTDERRPQDAESR